MLKKSISFALVLLIILSVLFCVPFTAATSNSLTETGTEPKVGDVIYYNNSSTKFSQVYCYMWEEHNGQYVQHNAEWPGVPMKYEGNDIWSYTLTGTFNWVIFTDNSTGNGFHQTDDLPYPGNNKIAYGFFSETFSGRTWDSLNFSVNWLDNNTGILPSVRPDAKVVVPSDSAVSSDINIKMQKNFGFTVPSDVPIIGGGSIKIDLSFCPISAKIKGDKLYIGLGVSNVEDLCSDKQKWCNFKNYVAKYKKDIKKGKQLYNLSALGVASAGFGKPDLDVDFFGYFEATINDGKIVPSGGVANLKIGASINNEWQTVIGPVPIVIKVKGEIEADNTLNLSFDGKNLKFSNELKLALPKITASAGVGIAYVADVSVYGEGRNEIKITNVSRITGTLYGELGVSAKFLMFSGKLPLLTHKNGWTYYDSAKKSNSSATGALGGQPDLNRVDYTIDRSYIDSQSKWYGVPSHKDIASTGAYTGASDEIFSEKTLQSSIYYNAAPKMIKAGDDIILVWTGDDPSRSTGNETVVYYSLYDSGSDSYSTPVAVEDNGTADFYPDIATDGENTYIVWVDTDTTFDEDVTFEEMAAACEIKVARFDTKIKRFTDVTRLTDNNTVDIKPAVAVKNSKPVVVWKSNSDNSMLSTSGTESVFKAVHNGESYLISAVYTSEKPVYELVTDGESTVLSVDGDSDGSTSEDVEIVVIPSDGEAYQLTDNSEHEYHLAFSSIGSEKLLTYQSSGVIYGSKDLNSIIALSDEDAQIFGEYSFVTNGTLTKLYSAESSDISLELFSYSVDDSGLWGNALKISDTDAYVQSPSFIMESSGKVRTAYAKTLADITEESVIETTDLCVAEIRNYHSISIVDVSYDSGDIIPGKSFPLTLTLANTGTYDENAVNISVVDPKGYTKLYSTIGLSMKSGEKVETVIEMPVDSDITGLTDYKINVKLIGSGAYANDSTICTFGYSSLQLRSALGTVDGKEGVVVNVLNNSKIPTPMSLVIKGSKDAEEPLDILYLGNIEGNVELQYFIGEDKIRTYQQSTDTLCFELVSFNDEEDLADNTDVVIIDSLYKTDDILGDANGDGAVDIRDATIVQRYVASYAVKDPEIVKLCGDINGDGVSILDATLIQRYLACYKVTYDIGRPISRQ